MNARLSYRVLLALLLFSLVLTMQSGSAQASTAHQEGKPMQTDLSPLQIERFIDNFVHLEMEASHTPGMAISVVYKDEIVLAKGYGYADLEANVPFSAATTLRAGSVSKPVTSAAVLALVDQGLLRLDAPVSEYLPDMKLDDAYGPAATISQLLTLQGGYADVLIDTHSPLAADHLPFKEYLENTLPPRTIRPATAYSYSSFDHGLLGLAMQESVGKPFSQVTSDSLFAPLGMTHSTFEQPLPADIEAALAQGYFFSNGAYQEVPLDHVNLVPGIGLVTTAEDMGRFMQMLLGNGWLDGEQVLSAESVEGLLTRQNEVDAYSRARTFGFSEVNLNDRAALYHDGNGIGFSNRIVLIPEQQFGMFISVNHRSLGPDLAPTAANGFVRKLSTSMAEAFFPPSGVFLPGEEPLPDAADRSSRYAGHYVLAGTPQHDLFKIQALLDNVNVRDNGDGTIRIGSNNYVETRPGVFRTLTAPYFYTVFTFSPSGEVEYLAFGGTGTYAKVSAVESFNVQVGLAAIILLVTLATTVIWPFTRQSPASLWLASVLSVIFFAGLGLALTRVDLLQYFKGVPATMQALLSVPWLQTGLTAVSVFLVLKHPESLPHAALPLAGNVLFSLFARYWQLFL